MAGRIKRTASRNTTAGALRSYIHFQQRATRLDEFDNEMPSGEYETKFSLYANFRPLVRGNSSGVETVFASQLQGNMPFVLTVRKDPRLEDVTVAWKIVNARKETEEYNIISPPVDPSDGDMWMEFIVSQGKRN